MTISETVKSGNSIGINIDEQKNGRVTITARKILAELFLKRRLLPGEEFAEVSAVEEAEPHLQKIIKAVETNSPIQLILPAFPAKSPNRNKTLGPLPDLAEKHALENLSKLCDRIKHVYEPGAELIICSDGRVFADLVKIPDVDVTAYGDELRRHSREKYNNLIKFFNLDDVYQGIADYDTLREELLIQYGEPLTSLSRRCKNEKEAKAMYLGITRFIFEDYCGIEPFCGESRTSVQKIAKIISLRVIQRSNAWSRLLEDHYSDAIRLSIHPQFRASQKIGVYLADAEDAWMTPWHSVAIKQDNKVILRKRSEAQDSNSVLVFSEGRPSHFEARDCSAKIDLIQGGGVA